MTAWQHAYIHTYTQTGPLFLAIKPLITSTREALLRTQSGMQGNNFPSNTRSSKGKSAPQSRRGAKTNTKTDGKYSSEPRVSWPDVNSMKRTFGITPSPNKFDWNTADSFDWVWGASNSDSGSSAFVSLATFSPKKVSKMGIFNYSKFKSKIFLTEALVFEMISSHQSAFIWISGIHLNFRHSFEFQAFMWISGIHVNFRHSCEFQRYYYDLGGKIIEGKFSEAAFNIFQH
jgi:hypothetical protein